MSRPFFALIMVILFGLCCGCTRPEPHPTVSKASPPPPKSTVRFRDVAASAGLHYRWPTDGPRPRTILQTMGYGCAFLDYDGDGNLDILLVGPTPALYRGDGHGHFTEVSELLGLRNTRQHWFGCAVGDYDNDGFPDIYLSAYRGGVLLHNERGRRFRNVTAQVGLKPEPWGTSCAWADLDDDGYLELLICNYVDYDRNRIQLCEQRHVLTSCPPQNYPPLHLSVWQNEKGTRFSVATSRYLAAKSSGNSLGVAVADADGNGQRDIAVANDLMPGDLFHRPAQATGAFTNIAASSGTATDSSGAQHAGMGVDWCDFDNDGKLDLFVTTFTNETKCLYRNLGNGIFEEDAHLAGIGTAAWNYVAFGCKFLDADNDGWSDLIFANGHTSDNVHDILAEMTYRQPVQFFHNTGQRTAEHGPVTFTDETKSFTEQSLPALVGRGLATGDFDNDGRTDVLIVDGEGSPVLLHNETPPSGHWLTLHLVGGGKSNRDAYGARVTLTLEDGRHLVAECQSDGSYLSASDARVHFGLGAATHVDVTVRWPSGDIQTVRHLAADRIHILSEQPAPVESRLLLRRTTGDERIALKSL